MHSLTFQCFSEWELDAWICALNIAKVGVFFKGSLSGVLQNKLSDERKRETKRPVHIFLYVSKTNLT